MKDLHDVSIRQMLKEREWKDTEDLEFVRANKRPDRRGKCYAVGLETPGYVPQVVEKGDNVLALRLLQLLQWDPSRRRIYARHWASRAVSISRRRISVR